MSDFQQTPPMPPQAEPPKKGLHPMAWVGIGCGGLLVIGVLAVALVIGWGKRKFEEAKDSLANIAQESAAELMVEMHPDLEWVAEDPETGEVTVLVTSSGEELTFSPEELAEGRVSITNGDGETVSLGQGDLADVPAWVPRYPSAADEKALFHRETATEVKGLLTYSSADRPALIESFYDTELGSFSSQGSSSFTIGDVEQKELTFEDGPKELKVTLVVPGAGKPAEVTVSYSGPPAP